MYAIVLGVAIGVGCMVAVNWFTDNYKLRTPVIFQSPIVPITTIAPTPRVVPKKAIKTKTSTDIVGKVQASETEEALHAEIYEKVQMLESSGGKEVGLNAYCIRQGKWNSIGYSPSTKYCFDSQWQEKKVFGLWMQDKYEKGLETSEALCLWNKGIRTTDCEYYKNYLTIK
jgi:hypothetical protein